MEGDSGLVKYVDKVLSERGHCVLCLAEGAGQVSSRARMQALSWIYDLASRATSVELSAAMSPLLGRKVGGGGSDEGRIDIQICQPQLIGWSCWSEHTYLAGAGTRYCKLHPATSMIMHNERKMWHPCMHRVCSSEPLTIFTVTSAGSVASRE